MADTPAPHSTSETKGSRSWLKMLLGAGFLFFFIKGLVWLAIFAGVYLAAR
jgi:hypothetical protein